MANGQPKPAFYAAVFIVIVGLVGLALYRYGAIGTRTPTGQISGDELKQLQKGAEAPDASGITTVKEYNYVPAAKLPEVKGISNYTAMNDRTVRFAINVWAGWGPIIYANNGFKAGKVWKTPSGKDFKIELVLIDDPVAMRDAFAAGNIHVGWATLDMVPLFMEGLRKDSRVMPRIYQQVDWSNGGDGIVVRDVVKTVADLRGKTVVLAQNSPSHFFVLNALINGGVQPAEVNFKFTQDAFQAAAAFNADKSLAGVVSWAPDIYNLEKVKGNKIIVSTGTANKLIADVWFARADFARDHPGIVEALVRGIFDAMTEMDGDAGKARAAKLMAAGFELPEPVLARLDRHHRRRDDLRLQGLVERALVAGAADHADLLARQVVQRIPRGGGADQQAGAVDERQRRERHLLHAPERHRAGAALHVGLAAGDRAESGLRRHRHPLDLQRRHADLALDHADDGAAYVDGVAGRLLVTVLEGERQRIRAVGDRDRLRLLDGLEPALERRRGHLRQGDRGHEGQRDEKQTETRHDEVLS